jgi:hypothetical protein
MANEDGVLPEESVLLDSMDPIDWLLCLKNDSDRDMFLSEHAERIFASVIALEEMLNTPDIGASVTLPLQGVVRETGCLSILAELLTKQQMPPMIRLKIASMFRVFARNPENNTILGQHPTILPLLLKIAREDSDTDVQKLIAGTLVNMSKNPSNTVPICSLGGHQLFMTFISKQEQHQDWDLVKYSVMSLSTLVKNQAAAHEILSNLEEPAIYTFLTILFPETEDAIDDQRLQQDIVFIREQIGLILVILSSHFPDLVFLLLHQSFQSPPFKTRGWKETIFHLLAPTTRTSMPLKEYIGLMLVHVSTLSSIIITVQDMLGEVTLFTIPVWIYAIQRNGKNGIPVSLPCLRAYYTILHAMLHDHSLNISLLLNTMIDQSNAFQVLCRCLVTETDEIDIHIKQAICGMIDEVISYQYEAIEGEEAGENIAAQDYNIIVQSLTSSGVLVPMIGLLIGRDAGIVTAILHAFHSLIGSPHYQAFYPIDDLLYMEGAFPLFLLPLHQSIEIIPAEQHQKVLNSAEREWIGMICDIFYQLVQDSRTQQERNRQVIREIGVEKVLTKLHEQLEGEVIVVNEEEEDEDDEGNPTISLKEQVSRALQACRE